MNYQRLVRAIILPPILAMCPSESHSFPPLGEQGRRSEKPSEANYHRFHRYRTWCVYWWYSKCHSGSQRAIPSFRSIPGDASGSRRISWQGGLPRRAFACRFLGYFWFHSVRGGAEWNFSPSRSKNHRRGSNNHSSDCPEWVVADVPNLALLHHPVCRIRP